MSITERRRHPRVPIALPLRLTVQGKTVDTEIVDLSASGIRFRTPVALDLMSRVQIALELPGPKGDKSAPLAATGVVVRSESEGDDFDTAIYFDELSDHARTSIARFVGGQKDTGDHAP